MALVKIPYWHVSFCDDNPAEGRWDQAFIERVIRGEEWRVPAGVTFEPGPADINSGGIVIFPAGHYADHSETQRTLQKLQLLVNSMPWCILIATSDEGSTFPWARFKPPQYCRLWVQTPRSAHSYPHGTRFFGYGAPEPAEAYALRMNRDIPIFFSGQVTHSKRDEMWEGLEALLATGEWEGSVVKGTAGFAEGLDMDTYIEFMARARFAPAPSGPLTQDSFRFYEALEAGAYPLFDLFRPDNYDAYWPLLFDYMPLGGIADWHHVATTIKQVEATPMAMAQASAWWQQQKRRIAHDLNDDVWKVGHGFQVEPFREPDDEITVIVVTSPSPVHPNMTLLNQTVNSLRLHLPRAEVLIGFDGVREEQADRAGDYEKYVDDAVRAANPINNVCPFVFEQHAHQSGMMRRLLQEVRTPYVLFMEHDTPLTGVIDWKRILQTMSEHNLNSMRFMHEAAPLKEHKHLYLKPQDGWIPTIQWSQRPHVARTDWYREIINTYFGVQSRTMIEDVMHGVVQHGTYAGRKQAEEAWERWRMAVYAPAGDMKRSLHLDGRAGDPKYGMFIAYDGERPEGAPPEGWL